MVPIIRCRGVIYVLFYYGRSLRIPGPGIAGFGIVQNITYAACVMWVLRITYGFADIRKIIAVCGRFVHGLKKIKNLLLPVIGDSALVLSRVSSLQPPHKPNSVRIF